MILDQGVKTLELSLAAAPTNPIPWTVEVSEPTQVRCSDGAVTTTTPVTLVATSALTRTVSTISIYNADIAPITVTLSLNNNGQRRTVYSVQLMVGDNLQFQGGKGFSVIDANGNVRGLVPLPLGSATDATTASLNSNMQYQLRLTNLFLAQQLQLTAPTSGFVLIETPAFLTGG